MSRCSFSRLRRSHGPQALLSAEFSGRDPVVLSAIVDCLLDRNPPGAYAHTPTHNASGQLLLVLCCPILIIGADNFQTLFAAKIDEF
jgi:hypothetical protein